MPIVIDVTISREPAPFISEVPAEHQINAEYLADLLIMHFHNMFLGSREYVKVIIHTPNMRVVTYPRNDNEHREMLKRVFRNRAIDVEVE